MRHYVLTLILSAFFLTSNGQEIVGDPDNAPKKPISLTSSSSNPPSFYNVIDNNLYIPIHYNFALSPTLMQHLFQSISHNLDIHFYLHQELIATKHIPPAHQFINYAFEESHCTPCYSSTNYEMIKTQVIDLMSIPEFQEYECEDFNRLTIDIQIQLFGVTFLGISYPIQISSYSSCSQPSPWPALCYTNDSDDSLFSSLHCTSNSQNTNRSQIGIIHGQINSPSSTSIYSLDGKALDQVDKPGLYIVCVEPNGLKKCHIQYITGH